MKYNFNFSIKISINYCDDTLYFIKNKARKITS